MIINPAKRKRETVIWLFFQINQPSHETTFIATVGRLTGCDKQRVGSILIEGGIFFWKLMQMFIFAKINSTNKHLDRFNVIICIKKR